MKMDLALLENHVPIRFLLTSQGPVFRWCYFGDRPFSEPFWDHDVEAQMARPANLFFQPQTTIDQLSRFVERVNAPTPAGFIFHMSRCGSTLITQLLRALPQNIALSEPSVVDSVLRIRQRYPAITVDQQAEWLRLIVAAAGYPRRPAERNLFVKFDCWNVSQLPLLRRAFPQVPFVFVYREPVEVMVSQTTRPGAQMMPHFVQAENYGIPLADAIRLTQVQYCGRVLASVCRSALEYHRQDPMLLINYRQFPDVIWNELARYWGIKFDANELEILRANAGTDAKHPEISFHGDSEQKRQAAGPELIEETERLIRPWYNELEAERSAQLSQLAGEQN
jgi:hypothetical protein